MSRIIRLLAVSSFALSLSGVASANPARIAELKKQIIEIASANTGRTNNFPQVREQLDPLVAELLELAPVRTEAEKLPEVVGTWKSLWSDLSFGFGVQEKQVYQVVTKDGYYYNFFKILFGPLKFTGFLRGEYVDQGDFLRIKFTANRLQRGYYPAGTDLNKLIPAFEANGYPHSIAVPGPIGVEGNLVNAFVDDQLRVVTGNSDGQSDTNLYILLRTDTLVD